MARDEGQISTYIIPETITLILINWFPSIFLDAYYDVDTQLIIIVGRGHSGLIMTWKSFRCQPLDTVISTQVDGSYDTVDISSLPDSDYCIIIASPSREHTLEGFFCNY